MLLIKPTTLLGHWIQLEPLDESHRRELYDVAQDKTIWTHTVSAFGDRFDRWFGKAMDGFQRQEQVPFIVRRLSDKKIVGSTRYYDINAEHCRLAIGYTWYVPEAWGTCVNPECKFLLLKFAFENAETNRVEFMAGSRNARSCAAIQKLGAIKEGVLRQHMILGDGFVRDTVIFSIVKSDWPQIKSALQLRLKKFVS